MKVLLFGYGSIGQRHAANLKALRPDAELYRIDPPKHLRIIDPPPHYDAAIIASPTELHGAHMEICGMDGIPFYVEKPVGTLKTGNDWNTCAVGYQYRFHPEMPKIAKAAGKNSVLHFWAGDDLLKRYGPDVDSVIAAHPIATALWLLGPAFEVRLRSDGLELRGSIKHERGISDYECRIDCGPRHSTVTSGKVFVLPPDNRMYLDALDAWLRWVEGGKQDKRTCTLEQGLAVERVLRQVKHVEKA